MKSLATTIVAGRPQAIIALMGFALLAVLIPFIPIGIIASGAAVVLLCLYHSSAQATFTILLACAAMLALSVLALHSVWFAVLFCGLIWLLPMLISRILKSTESLSFCVQIISISGLLLIVGIKLAIPDIDQLWHELFIKYINILSQHTELDEQTKKLFTEQVPYGFTAQLIASIMLLEVVIILVGYWWFSLITEQVSFRETFNQLKLGKFLGSIALGLAFAALVLSLLQTQIYWVKELTLVALSLFILQGLAIVHTLVAHVLKSRLWLIAAYAALILVPFFGVAVTLTGVLDNFISFRRFIKNS